MKNKAFTLMLLTATALISYGIGNMQSKNVVADVPKGYVRLEECIPLEDISCKFTNGDYLCVGLGDITRQLDNPDSYTYEDILYGIEDITEELKEDIIDMNDVVDFDATETGLIIYTKDGSGYYWER